MKSFKIITLVTTLALSANTARSAEGNAQGNNSAPNLNAKLAGTPDSPEIHGTDAILTARELADYGQRTESALALACAAEILLDNPTVVLDVRKTQEGPAGEDGTKPRSRQVKLDAKSLLSLAKTHAGDDRSVLAKIRQLETRVDETSRGAVGGPKVAHSRVRAGSTDVYTIYFRGGLPARVSVIGDGDTDLDLFIHDENGNFVTSDTDSSDYCVVTWYPRWTGPFQIRIQNLGGVYNQYRLLTN